VIRALHRLVLVWHRRLGLAAIPFVVLLSITGLLVQHGHRLGLDRAHLTADWLLLWYGIESGAATSFRAGESWVSGVGGSLYVDGARAVGEAGALVGAAAAGLFVAAATADAIYLLAPDGTLVEKVTPVGVAPPIAAIASDRGGGVRLRDGAGVHVSDPDLAVWRRAPDGAAVWPAPAAAPRPILAAIAADRRGAGVAWERVLLDLHSGRLLGAAGPWLMDAAAVLVLLLAASGLSNWLRRR